MKKKICFTAIVLGSLMLGGSRVRPAAAADPHLYLAPTTGSHASSFNVEVKVDTGGKAAGGVDAYFEFPANLLKVNSVSGGTAFQKTAYLAKNEDGKLRINAYFDTDKAGSSYLGSDGLVATINFSPLASGTAKVNFICTTGATSDSNIIEKVSVSDVINCASNISGSYSVSSSSGSAPAPTATSAPSVPVSGSITPTLMITVAGMLFLLTGLVLVF